MGTGQGTVVSRTRRGLSSRVSTGHVVMVLAGALGVLLTLSVLRSRRRHAAGARRRARSRPGHRHQRRERARRPTFTPTRRCSATLFGADQLDSAARARRHRDRARRRAGRARCGQPARRAASTRLMSFPIAAVVGGRRQVWRPAIASTCSRSITTPGTRGLRVDRRRGRCGRRPQRWRAVGCVGRRHDHARRRPDDRTRARVGDRRRHRDARALDRRARGARRDAVRAVGHQVSEPEVALAFTADIWVEELHRHLTDHGGARVRTLLVEPEGALEEAYDVLVAGHRWPRSDTRARRRRARARARGRRGARSRRGRESRTPGRARGRRAGRVRRRSRRVRPRDRERRRPARGRSRRRGVRSPSRPRAGRLVDRRRSAGRRADRDRDRAGARVRPARPASCSSTPTMSRPRSRRGCTADRAEPRAPRSTRSSTVAATSDSCVVGRTDVAAAESSPACRTRSAWAQVRPGEVVRVVERLADDADVVVADGAGMLEEVGDRHVRGRLRHGAHDGRRRPTSSLPCATRRRTASRVCSAGRSRHCVLAPTTPLRRRRESRARRPLPARRALRGDHDEPPAGRRRVRSGRPRGSARRRGTARRSARARFTRADRRGLAEVVLARRGRVGRRRVGGGVVTVRDRRVRHHPARRDHRHRTAPAAARPRRSARCASRSSARSTTISGGPGSATRFRSGDPPEMAQRGAAFDHRARPAERAARAARRRGGLRRGRAGDVSRHRRPAARPDRADDRGREPPDHRPAARGDRAAAQRQASARAGAGARRNRSTDRCDRARRRPAVGDRSALHGPRRHARCARRPRRADRAGGRLLVGGDAAAEPDRGLR